MRLIAILLSVFFAHAAVAEPKRLVCDTTAASEVKRYEEMSQLPLMKRENVAFWKKKAQRCREQKGYGQRKTFTFDSDALSNPQYSRAELVRVSCGGFNPTRAVEVVNLSTSPSIISFLIDNNGNPFNIDRKTLEAGFETKRDYKCKLEDIDTSDNVI